MDASLATTYTLIHSFLRKHSHTKAALAVKKAAKDIVVLKDDIEIEEPHLDTIIKEWKASKTVATRVASSDSSSDSESEDSSDSDSSDSSDSSDDSSDSSDSSDDSSDSSDTSTPETSTLTKGQVSEPGKPHEQVKTKTKSKTKSSSDESSSVSSDSDDSSNSDSDSDSSDSDTKTIKPDQKLIKTKVAEKTEVERQSSRTLTSGNSSSSSVASDRKEGKKADNSDSSNSEDDAVVKPKPAKKAISPSTEKAKSRATKQNKNKKGSSSSSTSDSSSSDSDSSIVEDKPDAVKPNKKHITRTDDDATPALTTKKRKTTEDGAAVVTATTETVEVLESGPQFDGRIKPNGKPARKTNTPFKRVDLEKVDQQSLLQDNGYIHKGAPTNDYGARAHQDLIVTRGAGFRKEKNKKKRGSYKGGTITLESHSFKFT